MTPARDYINRASDVLTKKTIIRYFFESRGQFLQHFFKIRKEVVIALN